MKNKTICSCATQGRSMARLPANNLWLLIFPVVYWTVLTVLMKHTEEKWLAALLGQTYQNYCKQVNCCIP